MTRTCDFELELELIQPHMAQKPVLRGEVGCACVAREVSVERGGMKTACSLRGVARIRQAALTTILGGATRAGSFADGDMAGAENAWGASGGHVHGGAPP